MTSKRDPGKKGRGTNVVDDSHELPVVRQAFAAESKKPLSGSGSRSPSPADGSQKATTKTLTPTPKYKTVSELKAAMPDLKARAKTAVDKIPARQTKIAELKDVAKSKADLFRVLKTTPFTFTLDEKESKKQSVTVRFDTFLATASDTFIDAAFEQVQAWKDYAKAVDEAESRLTTAKSTIERLRLIDLEKEIDASVADYKTSAARLAAPEIQEKRAELQAFRVALIAAIKSTVQEYYSAVVNPYSPTAKPGVKANTAYQAFVNDKDFVAVGVKKVEFSAGSTAPSQVQFDDAALAKDSAAVLADKLNAVMAKTKLVDKSKVHLGTNKNIKVHSGILTPSVAVTADYLALQATIDELAKADGVVRDLTHVVSSADDQLNKQESVISDQGQRVEALAIEHSKKLEAVRDELVQSMYGYYSRLNKMQADLKAAHQTVVTDSPLAAALQVSAVESKSDDSVQEIEQQLAAVAVEEKRIAQAVQTFAKTNADFLAQAEKASKKYNNGKYYESMLADARKWDEAIRARQAAIVAYKQRKELDKTLAELRAAHEVIAKGLDLSTLTHTVVSAEALSTRQCDTWEAYDAQLGSINMQLELANQARGKVRSQFDNFAAGVMRFRQQIAAVKTDYTGAMLARVAEMEESVRAEEARRSAPVESSRKTPEMLRQGIDTILGVIARNRDVLKQREEFTRQFKQGLQDLAGLKKEAEGISLKFVKGQARLMSAIEVKADPVDAPLGFREEKQQADPGEETSPATELHVCVPSESWSVSDPAHAKWEAVDSKLRGLKTDLKSNDDLKINSPDSDLSKKLALAQVTIFTDRRLRVVEFVHEELANLSVAVAGLEKARKEAEEAANKDTTSETKAVELAGRKRALSLSISTVNTGIANCEERRKVLAGLLFELDRERTSQDAPIGEGWPKAQNSDRLAARLEEGSVSAAQIQKQLDRLRSHVKTTEHIGIALQESIDQKTVLEAKAEAAKFQAAQQITRLLITAICQNENYLSGLVSFFGSCSKIAGKKVPGSFAQALDTLKTVKPDVLATNLDDNKLDMTERNIGAASDQDRAALYAVLDTLVRDAEKRAGFMGSNWRYCNKPIAGSIRNKDVTEFLNILQLVKSGNLSDKTVAEVQRRLKALNGGNLTCSAQQQDLPAEFQATTVNQFEPGCWSCLIKV